MINLKEKLKKNNLLKNFAALFSATLFAQFISIITSPILTRIYTPQDFGYYSFYISVCSLLIVYTTGRYEFAINTVKLDRESQTLFKVVVTLSISFFILIITIEQVFYKKIIEVFGLEDFSSLLYFIPMTILLMGIMQALNYYLNKYKEFAVISKSRVVQSSITSGGSLLFGFLGLNSLGLVIANIIGITVSLIYNTTSKKLGFLFDLRHYKLKETYSIAKKFRQYPLYNSTSAFFDNLAMQAPIFILMRFFTETIVGFYSLTVRVLGMPLTLISTSISQVFLSEIAELNRMGKPFIAILIKLLKILVVIGLIPTIILVTIGPSAFELIFGKEWRAAGELSQILAFAYYAKFVVGPLSVVFFVTQKVKLLSLIQAGRAITTIVVLLIGAKLSNIKTVVLLYTIHEVIFYLVYLYFILKVSPRK